MIDWTNIAANTLWLLGLALGLAVLSYASWAARLQAGTLRQQLQQAAYQRLFALAGALFCLGLAATAAAAWETAVWALLTLAFIAQLALIWRRVPTQTTDAAISALQNLARFLVNNELWPVALAIGVSMVYPPALPWALGVAALFWALRWLVTRRPTRPTPADIPILLLVLVIPVTLWATAIPAKTWPQVLRLLTGIALFYTFANWATTPARLRLLADGAVGVGLLLALVAPLVVLWSTSEKLPFLPGEWYNRFPTLVADTANPNVMAGFLTLFFPVASALLLYAWPASPARSRLLAAASTLLIGAALVLTQSRGALLAMGTAAVVVTILRWRWAWTFWLAAGAAGALLLQAIGVDALLAVLTTNQTLGSLAGRQEVWACALYMIQDFPFTGIGMGSFTEVADLLYPFFLHAPGQVLHTHNLFLQVAVDLGLPGLIAWLAVWLLACATAWQIYRHGRTNSARWAAGLGAGLLGSQVALGIHGLLDAVTWGLVRPAPLVWALWGLTFAGWNVFVSPREEVT